MVRFIFINRNEQLSRKMLFPFNLLTQLSVNIFNKVLLIPLKVRHFGSIFECKTCSSPRLQNCPIASEVLWNQ